MIRLYSDDIKQYLKCDDVIDFDKLEVKAATSIESTRRGFEESFATGTFYNRQTLDPSHRNRILEFVKIREGMKILDLGTGSGYLSFPIAKNNPGCDVIGLDIVNTTLEANRTRADSEGIKNLSFVALFKETLRKVCDEEEAPEQEKKVMISDKKMLDRIIHEIRMAAEDMDCDRIDGVFAIMKNYSIPKEYEEIYEKLIEASENYEYKEIISLIDGEYR